MVGGGEVEARDGGRHGDGEQKRDGVLVVAVMGREDGGGGAEAVVGGDKEKGGYKLELKGAN